MASTRQLLIATILKAAAELLFLDICYALCDSAAVLCYQLFLRFKMSLLLDLLVGRLSADCVNQLQLKPFSQQAHPVPAQCQWCNIINLVHSDDRKLHLRG